MFYLQCLSVATCEGANKFCKLELDNFHTEIDPKHARFPAIWLATADID
jgi:hypothetical protein